MMETIIIIAVLVIVLFFAIRSSVKHFRGEGGCCGGGGDYKPRKKKRKRVIATKTFLVEGMHCEKCSNRVTEAVNDIPHVSAKVRLKAGEVLVSYEEPIGEDVIQAAIERAGYTVAGIRQYTD